MSRIKGNECLAPYLLENPKLGEIIAVAEPNEEKRNNTKEENTYPSYEELLSKPKLADAIIIANSDESHFESTKTALEISMY